MMKLLKLNVITYCALFFCLGRVQAQGSQPEKPAQNNGGQLSVVAKLDNSSILLGDQTVFRLEAELSEGTALEFPLLADTLSEKIQIISGGKTDTTKNPQKPGMLKLSRAYVITSFDAGMQVVPALRFTSGGRVLQTESLPLEVKMVAVDTTKAIYDIKEPMAVTYTWLDWLRDHRWWCVAGVLLLLGIAGVWYYFKKRRKPKPMVEKVVPQVPEHVTAIEQLHALRERKLWQQGEVKAYYIELTGIIRDYLEKRYAIHAQEQTSDEILEVLKKAKMRKEENTLLREILLEADLVKFAKAQPVGQENEQRLEEAIRFVQLTKREPGPVSGGSVGLKDQMS